MENASRLPQWTQSTMVVMGMTLYLTLMRYCIMVTFPKAWMDGLSEAEAITLERQ